VAVEAAGGADPREGLSEWQELSAPASAGSVSPEHCMCLVLFFWTRRRKAARKSSWFSGWRVISAGSNKGQRERVFQTCGH